MLYQCKKHQIQDNGYIWSGEKKCNWEGHKIQSVIFFLIGRMYAMMFIPFLNYFCTPKTTHNVLINSTLRSVQNIYLDSVLW